MARTMEQGPRRLKRYLKTPRWMHVLVDLKETICKLCWAKQVSLVRSKLRVIITLVLENKEDNRGSKHKSPVCCCKRGFVNKGWHRPTLPHVTAVPSALAGLTSLFGMGRGGHRRYRHLKSFLGSY